MDTSSYVIAARTTAINDSVIFKVTTHQWHSTRLDENLIGQHSFVLELGRSYGERL